MGQCVGKPVKNRRKKDYMDGSPGYGTEVAIELCHHSEVMRQHSTRIGDNVEQTEEQIKAIEAKLSNPNLSAVQRSNSEKRKQLLERRSQSLRRQQSIMDEHRDLIESRIAHETLHDTSSIEEAGRISKAVSDRMSDFVKDSETEELESELNSIISSETKSNRPITPISSRQYGAAWQHSPTERRTTSRRDMSDQSTPVYRTSPQDSKYETITIKYNVPSSRPSSKKQRSELHDSYHSSDRRIPSYQSSPDSRDYSSRENQSYSNASGKASYGIDGTTNNNHSSISNNSSGASPRFQPGTREAPRYGLPNRTSYETMV